MGGSLLEGTKVLNLASVGPAARAGWILGDYGAEVVRVGPVPRDGGVQIVPPAFAYSGDRHTRTIALDLRSDLGREVFLRLASNADVVIESFRPGVVDRLGIGFEAVRDLNPGVVYCSTSGFGQSGPCSSWAGHDIDYLAVGGFLATSEPGDGGKPPIPGATVADSAGGGMHAVMAILAALVGRARTGEGAFLDVAVVEGVLSLMALAIDEHLATGAPMAPGDSLLSGRYACYDTYRCADGRWVAVGAIEERFYRNLCRLLDCERWSDHQLDDAVQSEVRADLAAAFARKPRDEWVAQLGPADTCVAPVLSVAEVARHPHLIDRGVLAEATSPGGVTPQLGHLLAGTDRARASFQLHGPGTDTEEVLEQAGFAAAEVAALKEAGVAA